MNHNIHNLWLKNGLNCRPQIYFLLTKLITFLDKFYWIYSFLIIVNLWPEKYGKFVMWEDIYVGHLESRNVCAYSPRSCLILADELCGVFSRVWTVAWCSSCCKLFHVVSVIGWDNECADINSRRLWGVRRDSVFAGGERQTLWNSPKTCCGLWWTCYERGQCPKMVHNVYEWANRCSWRWEFRATLWIGRRPSGTRRK